MKLFNRTIGTLVLMLAMANPASAFTAPRNRIILDITLAAGGGSHNVFVHVNEKKQTIRVHGFAENAYAVNQIRRTAHSFGAERVCFHVWDQS